MPGNQGLEHQDKLQSKIPTTTAWYSGFRHLCSWYSALSPSQDSEPSSGCCQYGLILTQAAGFSRGVALGWWEPLRQQVHHTPQTQKPGDWRTWGKLDINHQALASKGTTWDSIHGMEFLWNQADTGLWLRAHPYPAPFSATSLTPHRLRTRPQSSTSPWIPMSDFWATPLKTKI